MLAAQGSHKNPVTITGRELGTGDHAGEEDESFDMEHSSLGCHSTC